MSSLYTYVYNTGRYNCIYRHNQCVHSWNTFKREVRILLTISCSYVPYIREEIMVTSKWNLRDKMRIKKKEFGIVGDKGIFFVRMTFGAYQSGAFLSRWSHPQRIPTQLLTNQNYSIFFLIRQEQIGTEGSNQFQQRSRFLLKEYQRENIGTANKKSIASR